MSEALLEIDNISASYGAIQALTDVNLQVRKGEIVTLIGSNGAGKSTLLGSIFGSPRIHAGGIRFRGKNISDLRTHAVAPLGISLVPEGRHIFAKMTVEENLVMGTVATGGAGVEEGLERSWKMFPRLLERRHQVAGTMSGGEQQMLAISRALMSRPDLLLLDEPSLGLAPVIVKQIFRTLREISDAGTTIFLVEQNAFQALRLADRGYVLVTGNITLEGTGEELLNNPGVRDAYLGV